MAALAHRPPESAIERIATGDGLSLAVERSGENGPGIVFAHGFGQTRDAWSATAASLAASGHACLAYDARGHGESDWRGDAPYAWDQLVDDLATIARGFAERPVLVGASMGGLVGLAAEHLQGPLFRALVLVDVTPRWETRGLDRILGFMRAHPEGFASIDEAAAAVAAYLPHRAERKSPDRLHALLDDHGDGRLRWHWDPRLVDELAANSEAEQSRLVEAARNLRIPTLLISGGASDIVSDTTIAEFLSLVPHARHVSVPRATHMIVGDDNAAFTRHVAEFLATLELEEASS
jgi:pimeloyl-ACP methyl ester carboxylesterase